MFTNKLFITVLVITSLLEATIKGKIGLFRLKIGPRGGSSKGCIWYWNNNLLVKVSKNDPLFLSIFVFFDANLLGVFRNAFISGLSWHCNVKVSKIWPPFSAISGGGTKCVNSSLDGGVSLHFTVRYLWNNAPMRKKSRGWFWVHWGWLPPGTVQLCPPVTRARIKQIVWNELSIQHRP